MTRRIGIVAHSTNPRGGVVHALHLAEALCAAGDDAVLIAPDVAGRGFFRRPACPVMCIPARPEADVASMVERRIVEIRDAVRGMRLDIVHAQDPIGANALADLVAEGALPGFVRTVHHLDRFDDARLARRQDRGVQAATQLLCVSDMWRAVLRDRYGRDAQCVGNGVDVRQYWPQADARDDSIRQALGLKDDAVIVLAVGGVEARKNTIALFEACLALRGECPRLHLVIAGGATLLDHGAYRAAFDARVRAAGADNWVTRAGVMADEAMPALYRAAHVLAYPSVSEGFGLCPLEALACGVPVVLPRQAPFSEHLGADDAVWCDPGDAASLYRAMGCALRDETRQSFRVRGPKAAGRFTWAAVAAAHRPAYDRLSGKAALHA
ncbi:MSMEG_0565 family glycosyltransferase [Gluconacetobacter azotocaptans]|uniref:MSMEG_0565 family glycosyltransferase n=1 Tax=Gluconacetobacter azotocaptans TaxID=142834 RepID=UPI001958CFE0|nr:MSMEG_0565 family glycosyltransferase [Gluconacetobacter azotocaptans]MBM9400209.1 MSMEG_0565 family glycosyltransferase [Gluconacetobacter azotocaptans]